MDILPLCAEVPFKAGDIIKQTYQLQQQLGTGAYGVIFSALYTNGATTKHVAIKIEKNLPQFTLQANEVFIMKAMENCKHFAKFYQCGTHEDYKFVAMELLGPSLIQLANRHHPCRLNLHDLIKFGIQAVESLKELHKAGFVHRDVKPDNFVIGNQQNTTGFIYLIDFGLFKKINKENGVIVKPLQPSSFRGTLRYASPNAHKRIELGRSDDIISLFYLMIELFIGKLPWSSDIVLQQKLIYRGGELTCLNHLIGKMKQMNKDTLQFKNSLKFQSKEGKIRK
ncbi:MAG: hypothetical protein EZS28_008835 [Streblomastix strix]|uniref:non-specific serine/threonine protein kinase n=1 Tax=Streblomastix strix TaxID=222440 RepID=A0A5J4WLB4_9EUKA|nr:MAG: hypothetical protein EZS28_008835 [Streblomastix strix]